MRFVDLKIYGKWYKSSTPDLGSEGAGATTGFPDHFKGARSDQSDLGTEDAGLTPVGPHTIRGPWSNDRTSFNAWKNLDL